MVLIKTLGFYAPESPSLGKLFPPLIITQEILIIYNIVTNSEQNDAACRLLRFLSHRIPDPAIMNSYSLIYINNINNNVK